MRDWATGFPFQQAFEHFMIAPQTTWDRFFDPQIFVSLNSGDAAVENHVLRKAGSYGKQLGRILDTLDVLVARLPAESLTPGERRAVDAFRDRKSTRLNSSHVAISYAVFCLKKKKKYNGRIRQTKEKKNSR